MNPPTTTTVTVFTRHSPDCSQKGNPQWKRCNCRKSLYIYEAGKVSYLSAKTRSWEQAERVARAERDKRDPAKIELAKIEAKRETKDCGISDALDQWIAGMKGQGVATASAYMTIKRGILRWAEAKAIEQLGDVTPDALDLWVSGWTDKLSTQAFRLSRVRAFFQWATSLQKIDRNPAAALRPIRKSKDEEGTEPTMPLTAEQFEELIAATYTYDEAHRVEGGFGIDLRAIFLVQRWTGLRLSDVLMLPRSGIRGNRIITKTKKTGAPVDRIVPDAVIEALRAVPVRKTMHPDQYFWSRKCDHRTLVSIWTPRIKLINKYISFKDDKGQPMLFRSHMLRDTFAVELLLAGVGLAEVSRLLTHSSIRTTEKHYAPWVKEREVKLEKEMVEAMRKMGAKFEGDTK